MLWLAYSLFCALSLAIADLISKIIARDEDPVVLAFARWAYSVPFLLLLTLKGDFHFPQFNLSLFIILLILIPLEIIAVILYMKAYKVGDLSLSAPFQSFTPVFILFFSIPLLSEKPSVSGFLGIIFVVIGGYLMNVHLLTVKGLISPVKALINDKGPLYMLGVALIYGLTSVLGKMGVIETSSTFFAFFYVPVLTVIFALFLVLYKKDLFFRAFKKPLKFLPLGFFIAIMVFTHFKAIELIDVAYMISVKRLSMVMAVFFGHFLLKERNFFERLLGSTVMFTGVLIIAFGR